MKYPLHERIDEIHNLINEPRKQHSLDRRSTSYLTQSTADVRERHATPLLLFLVEGTSDTRRLLTADH